MCLPSNCCRHFAHVFELSCFLSGYLLHMTACKMSTCPIVPIDSPLVNHQEEKEAYLGGKYVCCSAYLWMFFPSSGCRHYPEIFESSLFWSGYLLHMSGYKMSICPIVPIDSPLKEENMGFWDWSSLSPIHTKCLLLPKYLLAIIQRYATVLPSHGCNLLNIETFFNILETGESIWAINFLRRRRPPTRRRPSRPRGLSASCP